MACSKRPSNKSDRNKNEWQTCLFGVKHPHRFNWLIPWNVFNVTLFMFFSSRKKRQDSLRFSVSNRQIMFSCPNSLLFRNHNWIVFKCAFFFFIFCFDLNSALASQREIKTYTQNILFYLLKVVLVSWHRVNIFQRFSALFWLRYFVKMTPADDLKIH